MGAGCAVCRMREPGMTPVAQQWQPRTDPRREAPSSPVERGESTHGRAFQLPPRPRRNPHRPGRLPFPRCRRPRHLRGQGEEPAQPPQQLFCVPADAEPEDLRDGAYSGERGVDRGGERDGIAAA